MTTSTDMTTAYNVAALYARLGKSDAEIVEKVNKADPLLGLTEADVPRLLREAVEHGYPIRPSEPIASAVESSDSVDEPVDVCPTDEVDTPTPPEQPDPYPTTGHKGRQPNDVIAAQDAWWVRHAEELRRTPTTAFATRYEIAYGVVTRRKRLLPSVNPKVVRSETLTASPTPNDTRIGRFPAEESSAASPDEIARRERQASSADVELPALTDQDLYERYWAPGHQEYSTGQNAPKVSDGVKRVIHRWADTAGLYCGADWNTTTEATLDVGDVTCHDCLALMYPTAVTWPIFTSSLPTGQPWESTKRGPAEISIPIPPGLSSDSEPSSESAKPDAPAIDDATREQVESWMARLREQIDEAELAIANYKAEVLYLRGWRDGAEAALGVK